MLTCARTPLVKGDLLGRFVACYVKYLGSNHVTCYTMLRCWWKSVTPGIFVLLVRKFPKCEKAMIRLCFVPLYVGQIWLYLCCPNVFFVAIPKRFFQAAAKSEETRLRRLLSCRASAETCLQQKLGSIVWLFFPKKKALSQKSISRSCWN